ncbi:hypothetical protein ACFV2H_49370, partial [Streptomyces sp. NPDC059629]|uniref:hypothetical protein n=1 Tax=Streptomyces sp. NPDC059629 TaxID=3346889 RepID=UPI0036C9DE9C
TPTHDPRVPPRPGPGGPGGPGVLPQRAATRQAVVFTNDDRLADAIGRFELPEAIWEVTAANGRRTRL